MNLSKQKDIIYQASGPEVVIIHLINNTKSPRTASLQAGFYHLLDEAQMAEEAFSVFEVTLVAGEKIYAWGDEIVEYRLFAGGEEIEYPDLIKINSNAQVEEAVDTLVRSVLERHWYRSIGEVAAISINAESKWQAEAIALNDWYNRVYELLDEYKAGEAVVSAEQFVDALPVFEF